MRKILLPFLVLAALFISLSLRAENTEVRIGAAGAFRIWNPAWNNGKIIMYQPEMVFTNSNFPKYPPVKSFQYGPAISIRFLDAWEITSCFHYSRMSFSGDRTGFIPRPGYMRIMFDIRQYDAHATAGYYVLPFLKPYAGMRVVINRWKGKFKLIEMFPLPAGFYIGSNTGNQLHFVPELGVSLPIPVASFFTPVFSVSGTLLAGSEKVKMKTGVSQSGISPNLMHIPIARYYAVGGNFSAAAVFTISPAHLSFTVGGYYRIQRFIQKSSDRGFYVLDGNREHDGGITAAVSCFFSIDQKRKRVWIPRPAYER